LLIEETERHVKTRPDTIHVMALMTRRERASPPAFAEASTSAIGPWTELVLHGAV
jgi:hypothetical protein